MRIFVAGATGVLGVPLVRRLVTLGHTVVGLTRSPAKLPLLRELGAEPAVADALDPVALRLAVRSARPEAIFHLLTALPKGGPRRLRDLHATNALRTVGTRNLLEAASAAGVRRVVAESMIFAYGYGDHGTVPLPEAPLPDLAGHAPGTRVSVEAMRTLEHRVCTASRTHGVEGVALRFGLLYGLGASDGFEAAARARKLPLLSGGRGVVSWVQTGDAVSALLAALERGRAGEVYNVVDDEPVSHRDFFGAMAAALGAPAPRLLPAWLTRLAPPVAAAFFELALPVSNAKAKGELGWTPSAATFREGLARLARPGFREPEPAARSA